MESTDVCAEQQYSYQRVHSIAKEQQTSKLPVHTGMYTEIKLTSRDSSLPAVHRVELQKDQS